MNDKPTRAQRDCFSIFCLILHSRCESVEMYSPPGGVSLTAVLNRPIVCGQCAGIFSAGSGIIILVSGASQTGSFS